MIEALDFPKVKLNLKRKGNQIFVWCVIRKMDLLCTPEEWVRQHVIHYLINFKNIPLGLIASEYSINYNGLKKRADIVVFNKNQKPVLIVECKATNVQVTNETLFQIAQYNSDLDVEYLFLTNGINHLICYQDKEDGKLIILDELPEDIV